jgi:ABC-type lipoprotein export system ATPase subunit
MSKRVVELKNISKTYGPHTVLKNISWQLDAGQTCAIVGPSGSGKSTLLNICGALAPPSSGQAIVAQKEVTACSEKEAAQLRNRQLGFVFQQHYLLPQCTVIENILLPTIVSGKSQKQDYARELLELVGLSERAWYYPDQLSGGEKQRVAVVRALINGPVLLLADEPTGSLDQENAQALFELLARLNREKNMALLVVTHDLELARKMAQVFQLKNGTLHEYH